MPKRWIAWLLVYVCLSVAPAVLSAQAATGVVGIANSPPRSGSPFRHDKELVATYDSLADSTHLAVVTHKGKYFLWIQHPRLTWTATYGGRNPGSHPLEQVVLVFRTQNPQVPRDNRLTIQSPSGERLEVASVRAYSDPGPITWSHFMVFPIPTAELTKALTHDTMKLSVGGIRVNFKPEHMEAIRDLLSRFEGSPPASESGGA